VKKNKTEEKDAKIKLSGEQEEVVEEAVEVAFDLGKEMLMNGLGSFFAFSDRKAEIKKQKAETAAKEMRKLTRRGVDSLYKRCRDAIFGKDDD